MARSYVNAFRDALHSGQFVVSLEYAAPDRSEPIDELLDLARFVTAERRIQTIAITDRVVAETAHDPIDLALQAAELTGKMPLVHLSGKNNTPQQMRQRFERMLELGLTNPLVVTGDVPRVSVRIRSNADVDALAPEGFLDSVQAIDLARRCSQRFYIAGAVTSFKYTEPTAMMQYLKLRKKIACGMDVVFNQVGYDLRKTQELIGYLQQQRLHIPAIAAIYWLTPGFARFAAAGHVPGVLITDQLVSLLQQWSRQPDKGRANRIEMMALHIVLARRFGYHGVHLGGLKKPDTVAQVLDRADAIWQPHPTTEQLWHRWRQLCSLADGQTVAFAPPEGFYLFQHDALGLNSQRPSPDGLELSRPLRYRILRGLHDLFFADSTPSPNPAQQLGRFLSRHRLLQRVGYMCERLAKTPLVGCEGCGSCSLPETEYVCIEQACAKG
ncbi:MAG: methylenetetrahydrofolate reductase, partial [Phycisphaerae bacterium]